MVKTNKINLILTAAIGKATQFKLLSLRIVFFSEGFLGVLFCVVQ